MRRSVHVALAALVLALLAAPPLARAQTRGGTQYGADDPDNPNSPAGRRNARNRGGDNSAGGASQNSNSLGGSNNLLGGSLGAGNSLVGGSLGGSSNAIGGRSGGGQQTLGGNSQTGGGTQGGNTNNQNNGGVVVGSNNGNGNVGSNNGNNNGNGNTIVSSSTGGVVVGSNNGNGNVGGGNGGGNGNGNTIVTGGAGSGNQIGGSGNQLGGTGNQGGNNNNNQGGENNQQGGSGNTQQSGSGNTQQNGGSNNQIGKGNVNGGGGSGNTQGGSGNIQGGGSGGNGNNVGPNGCFVNGVFRQDCAGGKSDPIMTGFAGRSFNFFGDVGKSYNLLTEANHQLSMHLKFAQLFDHNGTNMDRIGLQFKSYRVEMAVNEAEEVTVAVNDKLLPAKQTLQTHAWRFPDGHMAEMSWERNRPGLGNTVMFTTDTLQITSWYVPAGIPEPGHPENILGSYLNFNITLLGAPVGDKMEGIIGETYQRYSAGLAAISDPNNTRLYAANDGSWKGLHPIEQYEMANLWDTKFPLTLFNSSAAQPRERSQLELDTAFPVTARVCQHCEAVY